MRTVVVNAVAPSGSPKKPPALSFVVALFFSSVSLADVRAHLVSHRG